MNAVEQIELPSLRVCVVERGVRSRLNWVRCEIDAELQFKAEGLASYFFARWDPVVFDCLLLAAAVEFCDRSKKRPQLGWARDFRLHLPVHDPALWQRSNVSDRIHDALELLTGDRWTITFGRRRRSALRPGQETIQLPSGMAAIMPFSDGLDSRAVSALMSLQYRDALVHMRLGSKKFDRPVGKSGRKLPFRSIPYRVRVGKNAETSARSRGFKFAVLSGLGAYLAKAPSVIVSESGQGALGVALIPVGHAYEDFRNHPFFTKKMTEFFHALLGDQINYLFPRIWSTKGETLALYATLGLNDWKGTRSCWQDNRHSSVNGKRRQCGVCAACMLRRMSLHFAELREPTGTYVWDDLAASDFARSAPHGAKVSKLKRHYAIAGALHMQHMAEVRTSPLATQTLKLAAAQLSLALDISTSLVSANLGRMLAQHEKEWTAFKDSLGKNSFVSDWVV